MKAMRWFALVCVLVTGFVSCKVNLSFTGADTSGAQTFSVDFFKTQTAQATPILAQRFTEDFRDFVQNQSPVKLTDENGDLNYSGAIVGYRVSPVAVQADESAALNRLTISVKVKYENTIESAKDFERSFSAFADYETTQELSQVEEDLLDEILEQLFQDIYNASLGNW